MPAPCLCWVSRALAAAQKFGAERLGLGFRHWCVDACGRESKASAPWAIMRTTPMPALPAPTTTMRCFRSVLMGSPRTCKVQGCFR